MTVAEIGAGDGKMTVLLARRLGPQGRFYATEIDPQKLAEIADAVAEAGLTHVTPVRAGEMETRLPANCCDAIFLRRVYHHFRDPAEINARILASLREGGKLAVIDFPPPWWLFGLFSPERAPGGRGGHGTPLETLVRELGEAGFAVTQQIAGWTRSSYCVVAVKRRELGR
jgi:ubiquinone/menaquinone biosynthesis C-methylase UbiE